MSPPPFKVVASPLIHANFSGPQLQWLSNKFSEWVARGKENHFVFGKTVLEDQNRAVSHVHVYPQNDAQAQDEWKKRWDSPHFGIKNSRVSDRYLFFVEDDRHGYCLLLHLADPGAHDFRKTSKGQEILNSMFEMAQNFQIYGPSFFAVKTL